MGNPGSGLGGNSRFLLHGPRILLKKRRPGGKKEERGRGKEEGASSVYVVCKLPSSPEAYTTPLCGANHPIGNPAAQGACLFVRSPKGQAGGKEGSS